MRFFLKAVVLVIVMGMGLVLNKPAKGEDQFLATDMRAVRDIVFFKDVVWAATEGGLLRYEQGSGLFQSWTKLDGLAGVGLVALKEDGEGLWLLFNNRMIQRWVPDRGVTHTVNRLAQESGINSLTSLWVDTIGFNVYIATNRGVARLTYIRRYDRWVWEEEYRRFGSPGWVDPEVRGVVRQGDSLWVATNSGIAIGRIGDILVNSGSWSLHTPEQGLPSRDVRAIVSHEGRMWCATSGGTAFWDGARWTPVDNRGNVTRLYSQGGRLWAIAQDGLLLWDEGWRRFGPIKFFLTCFTLNGSGEPVVGSSRNSVSPGGVVVWEEEGWRHRLPSGPITNFARGISVTRRGEVLLVGGRGGGEFGLSRWDGRIWKNNFAPQDTEFFYQYYTFSVCEDRRGDIWVGSFMGGVAWFREDTTLFFNHFPHTGARLIGYSNSSPEIDLVLAPAIVPDSWGNIWIANRGAVDGRVLVCVPSEFIEDPSPERDWIYFHRNLFGNYPHFDVLEVDGRGRVWIASTDPTAIAGRGVYVLDHKGTLNDRGDDLIWGPLSGLGSPQIFDLTYDPAGYMWAGSIDGAYWVSTQTSDLTNASFTSIYPLRNVSVNAIAVDPKGNKWFGTDFGVLVIASDLFTVLHTYSVEPSQPLPASRVTALGFEPTTGRVWIGTEEGTLVLRTSYRDFGPRLVGLTVEPNPFNPFQGLLYFTGSSLAGDASVTILTADGGVVRRLSHGEAAWGWDGRDARGRWVSDGVYIVVAHNSQGEVARTKVAIVKER